MSTPEERALATRMIEALQKGDVQRMLGMIDAERRDEFTPEAITQIIDLTPDGSATLQTVNLQTTDSTTWKALNYEVGSGSRWAVVQIVLKPATGGASIIGVHVQAFNGPRPSSLGDFTLEGKSAIFYLWLVAMAAAVLTSLTALFFIVRTRGLKLKWLWAIGALLSFVTFRLDWATGASDVQPISFLLLGAGVFRTGPFNPWVMSFAIPVVAIVFLIRHAMSARAEADQPEEGTP